MNKADCFNLGHVAKLHGFKGEVSLFFDVTYPEHYANLDALFIEINGFLTPFFVERIKLGAKGFARVKLEGVDTETQSRTLLGKLLFLPVTVLPELEGNDFYDHEVIGYTVIDKHFGEVGTLSQIIDLQVNPLIQIDSNGKEVLIPMRKEIILNVDKKNKTMEIDAPIGLIQMYLE
jgi:16S rRNA processing protein RimM